MIESQLIALDIFSLAVVAPLSLALGILTLRGHPVTPVLALGPGLYAAYMLPQYILGPENLDLPGNGEAFVPLQLALFVLGGLVAVLAWNAIDLARLPDLGRRERLVGGILIPIAAAIAFVRYAPGIIDAAGENPDAADDREGPTFYWTIALLDLGVGLPAVIAAAIGLRRHEILLQELGELPLDLLGLGLRSGEPEQDVIGVSQVTQPPVARIAVIMAWETALLLAQRPHRVVIVAAASFSERVLHPLVLGIVSPEPTSVISRQ